MFDDQCCPGDFGGSHYHCPYCGCTCGMQGHIYKDEMDCPPLEERPAYAAAFVNKKAVQLLAREKAGEKVDWSDL